MDRIEIALSIIAGLVTAIPLVIKLVEYVQKATKEKNWGVVLGLVMDYMKMAETMFDTGVERKEWVIAMVGASAQTVNYDIDLAVIDRMIDSLCAMTKIVNPPTKEAGD